MIEARRLPLLQLSTLLDGEHVQVLALRAALELRTRQGQALVDGGTGVSLWSCSAWLFLSCVLLMAVCCLLPVLAFPIDCGRVER